MSTKKTKTEFEPGNEDKTKADSKKKGRESSEDDRQAPKPVQPQYPPAFGQQQQGQGQGQQGQAQGGWGWTPPSQQKPATPSTPTHSHPYSGFGQPGMGPHPGQSPHNQGQGMQGATPQSFSQYPQVPGPHQQGHQNQQPQQQPQQFHNPYNQPQFAQTMPPGGCPQGICPQGICPHGPQMNTNQQSPFQQGHGMNPQMQNYSFPEPNHSPQTPTPVNAQFGRNQPPPGQHSPNFGYPPQAPCCPHPHMQQGQMGQGQMGQGQMGHGGMMGPGQMGSSQMGPAQMNQNQPGFHRGDNQGMGPGVSHPPMGQGQPGFHMGDHQGMGPGVSHPPIGQGMGHPGMGPSFNQSQGPHGHGHSQGFGHPQGSFSQEDKQKQLLMDQHNYQAMQQQHEVNPRQVHPGTADDIRGTPIHSLDPNGPHGLHPPFHMPGLHNQDPHFYYYSLSYDIPQSHALNQAIGLERFRHPVSEWDMARRHQQQAQGDYRGKPRKAEQGREVKDDRENDRTKDNLRETERRGNRRDFDMEREQDRDRDRERNRERNARYRDDHSDTDRAPHTTTSEEEHDRDHRRINPRNFDTRYPDNVGPFIPYHPYPPGVHVPSPARHLGPHNLSPIVLPTPPNTPLHAQMMHQSMMPFPGHMPHVPMPGPFDSPFNMSYGNFLGPVFPPHYDSYEDRRPRNRDRDRDLDTRDKRRRRDVRRTPSSSPEHMNEEKKDNDKKEQS